MAGLTHFRRVGEIDISASRAMLPVCEEMFGVADWRERTPGTPHAQTQTIYLRMPSTLSAETVFHSLEVSDQPMMGVEPFAAAVAEIERLTGEPAARAMIVKLLPGGVITPHIDEGAYAEATNRYHVAIETNPEAWLEIGGERLTMQPGDLWFFDKHALHQGANEGKSGRVHLIVDTFRSGLKFQTEKLFDVKHEALPLLFRHWEEIAVNRDTVPLAPDWETYRKIEEAGLYHVTTARDGGRLVGYAAYTLIRNLHYTSLFEGLVDIFYLAPEYRKGSAGQRLLKAAESALIAKGVNKIVQKDKIAHSLAPLMKRMGYRAIETVYIKGIG